METELARTIKRALAERGETVHAASVAAGLGKDGLRNILRGKSLHPRSDTLRKLATYLDVPLESLAVPGDRSPMTDTMDATQSTAASFRAPEFLLSDTAYVGVAVYDVRVSAGGGSVVDDYEASQPKAFNLFRKDWISRVSHADPKDMIIVVVDGDSMWETLHEGDHVLVDTTNKNYRSAGMFVLNIEGEMYVKRLHYNWERQRVIVSSDNKAYEPFEVLPGSLRIIGRVIWLGRQLG